MLRAIRGQDNVGADCLSRNPLEKDDNEATLCKDVYIRVSYS